MFTQNLMKTTLGFLAINSQNSHISDFCICFGLFYDLCLLDCFGSFSVCWGKISTAQAVHALLPRSSSFSLQNCYDCRHATPNQVKTLFVNESIAIENVSAISLCNKVFSYSAKDSIHPVFHVYRNAVLLLH